ncbi:cysteine hydrolase family protein [Amorphus orientalis]|uniref:Ureidoacrylate peracid hydrolase n=1 Tax=Amorphus orientalis TaxID=649198 RepID=A0AAE3VKY1_9HYPH|nr:isochorismatase family cysteine hydrolase [Amorphus orientalis]MDQ0314394.1 ureidoacrylate peracid hydrolase [Amorphus orientalis]
MTGYLDSISGRLDRSRSAVVVIDMQNDFCAEGGYVETVVGRSAEPCRAVAEPIGALLADARAAAVPVIWVRADYEPDKIPPGMLAKQRERSSVVCCAPGSWGYGFYGVEPREGEAVFDKHCYSAFEGTGLSEHLRAEGIETLVFAGVQTNVCVETSFRDAVCRGFYGVLASDCVASHAPPLHEATLANIGFLFGDVLPREEIASHWQG